MSNTAGSKSRPLLHLYGSNVAQSHEPPAQEYNPCRPQADTPASRPLASSNQQSPPFLSAKQDRASGVRPAHEMRTASSIGKSRLGYPVVRKPLARRRIQRRSHADAPARKPSVSSTFSTTTVRPPVSSSIPKGTGAIHELQLAFDNFMRVLNSTIAERTQQASPSAKPSKRVCYGLAHHGACESPATCRYNHTASAISAFLAARKPALVSSVPDMTDDCLQGEPSTVISTSADAASTPTAATPRTDQRQQTVPASPVPQATGKPQKPVTQASPVSVVDFNASPLHSCPVAPVQDLTSDHSDGRLASLRQKTLSAFPTERDLAVTRQVVPQATKSYVSDQSSEQKSMWIVNAGSVQHSIVEISVWLASNFPQVDLLQVTLWLDRHAEELSYPCFADSFLAQLPTDLYGSVPRAKVCSSFATSFGITTNGTGSASVIAAWLSSTCKVSPLVVGRWLHSWTSENGSDLFTLRFSKSTWNFLVFDLMKEFKEYLAGTQVSDLSM